MWMSDVVTSAYVEADKRFPVGASFRKRGDRIRLFPGHSTDFIEIDDIHDVDLKETVFNNWYCVGGTEWCCCWSLVINHPEQHTPYQEPEKTL